MSIIVIHHSADFDGLFCREIARKKFGDNATYIGWDYGDPVPVVEPEDHLFMLDISVEGLMDHGTLTWIDHHKTAIEKYGDNNPGIRIDGVAACRLAWQFWFGEPINSAYDFEDLIRMPEPYKNRELHDPYAVALAGMYDVWDKRDPNTDTFQHGLKSIELTPAIWGQLLSYEGGARVAQLLERGAAVQFAKQNEEASIIKAQGFTVEFEGRTFLALNTARCNSLAFLAGLEDRHDGCLSFNWTGKDWRVSLYGVPGKPDLDFTPIATKWGGGGHRQACGFRTTYLPFVRNNDTASVKAPE